ncbi:MAG TPA: hypothetical protein VK689_10700 [Armatimonadota bacterium]|nr:hypothetical protein [Armatimonadota bacterium]
MPSISEDQQRKRLPRWLTFCLNALLAAILLLALLLLIARWLGYSVYFIPN